MTDAAKEPWSLGVSSAVASPTGQRGEGVDQAPEPQGLLAGAGEPFTTSREPAQTLKLSPPQPAGENECARRKWEFVSWPPDVLGRE